MSAVDVLNWKKEKVGQIELEQDVFGVEIDNGFLHSLVKWQLAKRRQGTHMTKTKGLVSGGGKKPFKQKGTGNARQGSTRSPLMPGGGTIFGPVPRDYEYSLPKKMRKKGLSMALSYLNKEGKLLVIENLDSDGKTGQLSKNLKNLGLEKTLLVDASVNEKTDRATRNLKDVKYLPVLGLNVFDLLKYNHVVLSKGSVSSVVEKCLGGRK